jgi:hypothetical protein
VSDRVIRFSWDYTVDVPLWEDGLLLPDDPEWLQAEFGISDGLIEALSRWGRDMNSVPGAPDEEPTESAKQMYRELDDRARHLVDWLLRELGPGYTVKYDPRHSR